MKSLFKDKLLLAVITYLIVVLIAIPLTLFTLHKPTKLQTSALGTASFTYSPSTLSIATGQTASFDIILNPGTHSVSFVTLDILYDPTKLTANQESAFTANIAAFPVLIEGPFYEPGRIRVSLSIGNDPTKAITTTTKVGTVVFTAEAPTTGLDAIIHFGQSSSVLSVGINDSATDNVLGLVSPALMDITGEPTGNGGAPVTPLPTFSGPLATNTPAPTYTVAPTSEISVTPEVSSTPGPSSTPGLSPTPPPFCPEDDRRSGWPECELGETSYNKQACRERAEGWKGVPGPADDSDTSWYAWATNPPKPLSCNTSCGIAPSVCQNTNPPATIQPTNTEILPSATSAFVENYAANQVNPADVLLISLLFLPLLLLLGHLLV